MRISGGERRYAKVYNIDYNRCIFCGYCVEACPTDAITHGHGFEVASYNTSTLVYTKDEMLAPIPAGAKPPVIRETEAFRALVRIQLKQAGFAGRPCLPSLGNNSTPSFVRIRRRRAGWRSSSAIWGFTRDPDASRGAPAVRGERSATAAFYLPGLPISDGHRNTPRREDQHFGAFSSTTAWGW